MLKLLCSMVWGQLKMVKEKIIRKSNFELMRIISMFFIIVCHVIDSGNLINNCRNSTLIIIFEMFMFLTRVHVNSFMLLSGYFQSKSKFKIKKLFKMVLQVWFYLIIFFLIALKFNLIKEINAMTILKLFLPSSINDYWFIASYIVTYIFSDYINIFINRMTRLEHKTFIILGFMILSVLPYLSGLKFLDNTGFNFFHFIYLYIVGSYLRIYPIKNTYHFKRMKRKDYIVLMLSVFISMFMLNYLMNIFANRISGANSIFNYISNNILLTKYCYSNPITIIQTIAYFEIFNSLNFKNKIINFVSGNVLGIYLFHENIYVRENIYKILKVDTGIYISYKKIFYFIFAVLIIFVIGFIIEYIRKKFEILFTYLFLKLKKV